jgi:hypothetical protein
MDITQVLWGVNTTLLGIILYFVKEQRDELKDMKKEVEKRTLVVTCDKIHALLSDQIHVHGTLGQAGEVIRK